MKTWVYSADDIRTIVRYVGLDQLMDNAIAALTTACHQFDSKIMTVPARGGFEYSDPHVGLIEWMPTMKSGAEVVIKMVGYHPENPVARNIPTILSTALSFDTQTGQLLTMLDATFLTAIRTGAASALASRILAPQKSRCLGLIGAGTQSIAQLHALSRVFELEQILVYDTDTAVSNSFPERAAQLGLEGTSIAISRLDKLVSHADIICTATSVDIGEGPVFEESNIKPSVHINAVGSDFHGKFEVPHSLLLRSLVCPDFLPQALNEGECQQLHKDQIGPDLVELIKNENKYRAYQDTSTIFDSTGWAFEDFIMVEMLVELGKQLGVGQEVELTRLSADPRNPYAFLETDSKSLASGDFGTGQIYAVHDS